VHITQVTASPTKSAVRWVFLELLCEVLILRIGGIVALAGMMTLLLSISADASGIQIALLQPSTAGTVGYALAVAGFANVALGGVLKFGLSFTETAITRQSAPAN